jgi:quinone-modifying oxidoreductase subunit QmoB
VSGRITESVFLEGTYNIRDHVSNRALVLGGDESGIRIAELLKKNGFKATVLIAPNYIHSENSKVDVIRGSISQVSGFVGKFDVQIHASTDRYNETFGFIIAAQPANQQSKTNAFSLTSSDKIHSLSEFKCFLDSGARLSENNGNWRYIAFFFDLKGSSDISQFETLLSILDRLEIFHQVQPYIFTRNLKVASAGLEARYRYHRQRGVVFFKFDGPDPKIVQNERGCVIEFVEPLLGEEMELTTDWIVLDEILGPPTDLDPLLKMIPSAPAFAPYLQPESTRFNGVESPKAGVYAVGPARGVFDNESLESDVDAVMVSVLKTFPELSRITDREAAFVDYTKCAFCLTCIRLCPHGAIGFHSRPEVDTLSCRMCGVCISECPMRAIQTRSSNSDFPEVNPNLFFNVSKAGESGRIKLLACSRSGLQAAAKINKTVLSDVEICALTCAGSLDPNSLMKFFLDGADGIIVAGCFKGNCASIYGSTLAEEKVKQTSRTLKQAGIDPERLEFIYLAGNTPERIVEAITRLKIRIDD